MIGWRDHARTLENVGFLVFRLVTGSRGNHRQRFWGFIRNPDSVAKRRGRGAKSYYARIVRFLWWRWTFAAATSPVRLEHSIHNQDGLGRGSSKLTSAIFVMVFMIIITVVVIIIIIINIIIIIDFIIIDIITITTMCARPHPAGQARPVGDGQVML